VLVGTALGDDMVLATGRLFEPVEHGDIAEYKSRSLDKRQAFQLEVEIRDLPEISNGVSKRGLGRAGEAVPFCGSCSMVCPPATATTWRDDVGLASRAGTAHPLLGFDASRSTRRSRAARISAIRAPAAIKFRFYHKQRGLWPNTARPSCVGCGRCISACE